MRPTSFTPAYGTLFIREHVDRHLGSQVKLCLAGRHLDFRGLLFSSAGVTSIVTLERAELDHEAPAAITPMRFGNLARRAVPDEELHAVVAAWDDPEVSPWEWWARVDQTVLAPAERVRLRSALVGAIEGWREGRAPQPKLWAKWWALVHDEAHLFPLLTA